MKILVRWSITGTMSIFPPGSVIRRLAQQLQELGFVRDHFNTCKTDNFILFQETFFTFYDSLKTVCSS